MSENQKLREVLQAISHIDDTTSHTADASVALDHIGQIARQALALPTEPAHADTWGISRAMVTLYAYECDGLTGEALALPTAEQVDDINVAESFTSVTKTAAPVCEREAFEREMSKPPFEFCMDRWPDDGSYAWPGNYAAYHTQCAWAAWQARAALSAGDAGDVQRLDFIEEHCRCDPKMDGQHVWWPTSFNTAQLLKGPTLREAIDNAALRAKGQS